MIFLPLPLFFCFVFYRMTGGTSTHTENRIRIVEIKVGFCVYRDAAKKGIVDHAQTGN